MNIFFSNDTLYTVTDHDQPEVEEFLVPLYLKILAHTFYILSSESQLKLFNLL